MAIAFSRVSIHTRTKGHSSVAGSAYRAGERRVDARTGVVHDFSHRKDVQHVELMLPDAAFNAGDALFPSGEALWNAAERMENRKDSQVAKDVVLALPRELSLAKQIELTRNFVNYHFVAKGLATEFSIHNDEDGNPHAHIYVTTRRLHAHGFDAYKARDLNPVFANSVSGKGFVSESEIWGEYWREFQNDFFQAEGLTLRVDESYLLPTEHEGRVRSQQELHHVNEKNRLQRETVRHIALHDTDSLLNLISERYAVFTERQLASVLFKLSLSTDEFQTTLLTLKAHRDILCLGVREEDGVLCYTTRQTFLMESQMATDAERLRRKQRHALPLAVVDKALQPSSLTSATVTVATDAMTVSSTSFATSPSSSTLTPEQIKAVRSITAGRDIALVVGRAGTGKSFLLRVANDCWVNQGYWVHGISVSGIAAKNLQTASGISSSTIARFKRKLDYGRIHLSEHSLVVMDEAGMTNLADMAFIVKKVLQARAKLVLVGDPDQLQPIGAGVPFWVLVEQLGFTQMEHIQRQQDLGDRAASYALAHGDSKIALLHYEQAGKLHWYANPNAAFDAMASNYLAALNGVVHLPASSSPSTSPSSSFLFSSIVLAYRNADVDQLNDAIRSVLIEKGDVGASGVRLAVVRLVPDEWGWESCERIQEKPFSVGDKLVFRKNDTALGVVNGEFARITAILHATNAAGSGGNGSTTLISVAFDNGRTLTFNPHTYQSFDYGYATTIHKSQGLTVDNVHVYIGSRHWNRHLAYVALTRHRHNLQLYADNASFKHKDTLYTDLSRKALPDSVLDWPLGFAKHRGFEEEILFKRLLLRAKRALGNIAARIKNTWELKDALEDAAREKTTSREAVSANKGLLGNNLANRGATRVEHRPEKEKPPMQPAPESATALKTDAPSDALAAPAFMVPSTAFTPLEANRPAEGRVCVETKPSTEPPSLTLAHLNDTTLGWEALRAIDNSTVQWIVQYRELALEKAALSKGSAEIRPMSVQTHSSTVPLTTPINEKTNADSIQTLLQGLTSLMRDAATNPSLKTTFEEKAPAFNAWLDLRHVPANNAREGKRLKIEYLSSF